MKKILALLLSLTLALGLAGCGAINKKAASDGAPNGGEIVIGGRTIQLTYESHHKEMYFRENVADIQKSSFGQACDLVCPADEGMLFVIHIVYFEGKSVDEVMSGSENQLTDKTAGGLEYRYFEYDENGVPGHTYIYHFNGTTYTISFVSSLDMTSLESAFLSNVHFEKEQ